MMKVLIVDDHVSYCEGLVAVLQPYFPDARFSFICEPQAALERLNKQLQVDLLLLDLSMPGMDGSDLISTLIETGALPKTLILSASEDFLRVNRLFELGVVGFLPKHYCSQQLAKAIQQCLDGQAYVPDIMRQALVMHERLCQQKLAMVEQLHITRRQLEVLNLMGDGLNNHEIAQYLFLSLATVKTHINRLFQALQVSDRIECVQQANQFGLLYQGQPAL
jgi:DNA-binding NarL/FixJ family response regulator